MILLSKSQISWTFLAPHFECTRLHLIFPDWHVGCTQLIHMMLVLVHICASVKFWPVLTNNGNLISKQNCKLAYLLAIPGDMCAILLKYVIHILRALDSSCRKIQEKFEIISYHVSQFWTKIPQNGTLWLFATAA